MSSEISEAVKLIRKDLEIPESDQLLGINLRDQLHSFLTKAIEHLLDHDFNKLLIALYRIDIPEKKVAETLELEEPEKIASTLANLIIDRELKKVETRRKYSRK